jgi:hypothetical protein
MNISLFIFFSCKIKQSKMWSPFILYISLNFLFTIKLTLSSQFETKLIKTLFKDYDKLTRPVENFEDPVSLTFDISIYRIIKVKERDQFITLSVILKMDWLDFNLKWEPEKFGNVTEARKKI